MCVGSQCSDMAVNGDDVLGRGGINIAHLNVASILGAHKFEMLKQQLEASQAHVFGISETWLNSGVPEGLLTVKGYNIARLDRGWSDGLTANKTKRGGGLLCFVHESLSMNEFRFVHLNNSTKDLEMQWVTLDMYNMRDVIIINVYRPPQGDYKKACKLIHDAIKMADLKDNAEIFLMGDFNINFNNKASPMTRELQSTTTYWGLRPQIKGITRLGNGLNGNLMGTCIDNIFTNSEVIMATGILDWNFSDHMVIAVKRKKERVKHTKVSFKGRSYREYVREDLQGELAQADWDWFYNCNDPSRCWEHIEGKLRGYLDRTCPQKVFKVRAAREPWVTNEILEEIKDKDSSLRKAKRSGLVEDWQKAKADRNRVGRLIEPAKADFLKEQQAELANDPKKCWRLVKTIVLNKKVKMSEIALVNRDIGADGINVEGAQTADFINSFFSGIGPKLAEKHKAPWRFHGIRVDESCPPLRTNFEQVMKLCRDIKTSKASGFDDISTKVFKDAFRVLVPQLVYLFNLSFESGFFPDRWKMATIIPLHKGGDRTEVGNYRPVSLLPLPGKIIERIAHSRITEFLNVMGVISDKQGGFRKGFSTSQTIADLTDKLFADMNDGKVSLAAFIDLRKAFDTVDHNILLKKLQCYGVKELNLKWCQNYLSNRVQRTLANGHLSSSKNITCGVPQGSVLGPLFFILYVNDVQQAICGAHLQLYADDTVLFASDHDAEVAARKLQPALKQFEEWCSRNKLSLNPKKTKKMAFGTRLQVKKAKNVTLLIANVPLQNVPTYKYLGILLDSTLSYNCHVNNVVSTVTYKANLLAKIRKFMTNNVALKIYKSMILPYFDYGDVIYNTANQTGLDKLQRVQNKCLKTCLGFGRRHETKSLHATAKVPMLEARRETHVNNFMYHRLSRPHLLDGRNIATRAHDAPMFRVVKPSIEVYKRSVEYSGAVKWNNLPTDIRNNKSSALFKAKQKNLLLSTIVE